MAKDKKTPSIASQGAVMRRVLQYIGPHVSLVVLSLALCLISVALTLYVPILVGRAVDCIVGPNEVDFAALTPILMTIAVCIVITAAALRESIESSISNATKMEFQQKLRLSNMILTELLTLHCCTMQMEKRDIS